MVNYTLKEKILKFLIENKDKEHSIREISQKLNTDYKNTSQALNNLNPKVYSKKKQGNTYLIEFTPSSKIEVISVEKKRQEEFLDKNPKLEIIRKYTEEMGYPFMIVLVFGSYVKNNAKKNSDIDLCIISDNKNQSKELQERLDILSLNIEIQEFTSEEFISLLEKRKENLSHEIIKKNILLYGIENYYNLVKNG